MKNASMNGASGSGCVAVGPPAMISGAVVAAIGAAQRDARQVQQRSSTFVYVSSYCSEKPTTSNVGQRRRRLERQERQPARAQLGLAVEPGRERALAGDVVGAC